MTGTPQGATPFTRSLINPCRAKAAAAPLSRLGLEIEAHRGDSAHAPENTLAAFHRAVAAGVPWIELDVHPSQDGALMVLHDDTVDRTTNGRGAVGDLAADDLRRLDAGSWFAPSFGQEQIPFLSEVMDLVGPTDTRLNVEIKASPGTTDVPRAVADLLRHHGKSHHYVVSSFDLAALLAVRAAAPEIALALIGKGPQILSLARNHNLPWVHAAHKTLSQRLIAQAHACGIRVNTWTVDDPATGASLSAMGVDKICTNCPAHMQAAAVCWRRHTPILRPIAAIVLAAALGCGSVSGPAADAPQAGPLVRLTQAPRSERELALPLTVWAERLKRPDPQAIHVLRIDLHDPALEVIAMPADDPDGAGPAEAALTDPRELAQRFGALAAVNASAFAGIPDADGKEDNRWRPGLLVDIAGVVVRAGERRSGPYAHAGNNLCFWLDQTGRPHFGPDPGDAAAMREAVNAWWGDLVADGQLLPKPGGDRHPRTAVGTDATGRWLYLVVVDGRQPFVSAGMTTHELAELMARLGCARAINLDGGGSSVMLAAGPDGTLELVNRPSGGSPRPVPVLLGVRRRGVAD